MLGMASTGPNLNASQVDLVNKWATKLMLFLF
jgi:hypothetical protein